MADNREGKIGFIVDNREVVDGVVHLSVRMLNSTLRQPTTNELPIILNTLANSRYMDEDAHVGFTYTFPFVLSPGWGFPYVLDMQFEEDSMLTLS